MLINAARSLRLMASCIETEQWRRDGGWWQCQQVREGVTCRETTASPLKLLGDKRGGTVARQTDVLARRHRRPRLATNTMAEGYVSDMVVRMP